MLDYEIKPFFVTEPFKIDKLYTMFHRTHIPANKRYVGESHDFWECIYLKDGNVCNCVDGKVYNMEKGDLIFYKPLEFHHAVENDKKADLFYFTFSLENCPEDFASDTVYKLSSNQMKIMEKIIDFSMNAIKNNPFTEEEIARQKAEYINYDYIRPLLAFGKNTTDTATVVNYIEELFLDLYNTKNVVVETDSFYAGIYRKAVFFMTEHISEKLTTPEIASYCNVGTTTLKKIFLEFSNLSIHKHFIKLKINHAIILLKSGASVNEAALRTGFSSQAYFSAAFKRETGATPRDYLKWYSD